MSHFQVSVPMDEQEYQALVKMAGQDYRHPRGQMRYLLREEARRRNLIKMECCDEENCDANDTTEEVHSG